MKNTRNGKRITSICLSKEAYAIKVKLKSHLSVSAACEKMILGLAKKYKLT